MNTGIDRLFTFFSRTQNIGKEEGKKLLVY